MTTIEKIRHQTTSTTVADDDRADPRPWWPDLASSWWIRRASGLLQRVDATAVRIRRVVVQPVDGLAGLVHGFSFF
jgi:hypothetical protein